LAHYLWIGLGGFLGANARYMLQRWAITHWGDAFPYGTMLANVSGSFVIAFFLTLLTERLSIPAEARLFLAVGFLGGFTTFSSFSFETVQLAQEGAWGLAVFNFLGNTVLGVAGVMLGETLAQLIRRGG
jgi:CrcB protein